MSKVKVTREVADAIEELHSRGYQNAEIIANWWMEKDDGLGGVINANIFDGDELINALTVGYEIEETPEEKVLNCYASYGDSPSAIERKGGIIETLNLLGLKIEGVNAN